MRGRSAASDESPRARSLQSAGPLRSKGVPSIHMEVGDRAELVERGAMPYVGAMEPVGTEERGTKLAGCDDSVLRELVSPMQVHEFISEFWNLRCAHFPGSAERFFDVFSERELARALFEAHLGDKSLRAACGGRFQAGARDHLVRSQCSWTAPPCTASLNAACQGGATLVFDSVHRRSASLGAWTRKLAREVRSKTVVNAYYSPLKGEVGLEAHCDPQEIFILHLLGKKRWTVWETLESFPIGDVDHRRRPDGPNSEVVLTPGDVLYLPRGAWHSPQVQEGPSLHLTVTMVPERRLDLLRWVFDELASDPEMRRDLATPLAAPAAAEASLQDVRKAVTAVLAREKLSSVMAKRRFMSWTSERLKGG